MNNSKQTVAFITEDEGHLTGGRYYALFIALALVELNFDVTVYTNRLPVFLDELKKYKQPEIKVIVKTAKELEDLDIKADIYIGSPISGNVAVAKLGRKYNKPAYALIFDPFPFMAKYLGDHTYVGWMPLLKLLKETDTKIISLCKTTSQYCYDWLNKRKDQVIEINPCINSREIAVKDFEKDDYVVFISRLVKHKNFDHVLSACRKLGIKLKVIASVDGNGAVNMINKFQMKKDVELLLKLSDKEKFQVIAKAKAVINASIFEGFGMWLIEAIALGTPCVCYEYPTFREIQKIAKADNIYFAEWYSAFDLTKQLKLCLEEKKYRKINNQFNFETMVKRCKKIFSYEPKIGVITIALNEAQFIQATLKAIIKHKNIAKVAVVEGAVNLFSHAATDKGLSIDDTQKEVDLVCIYEEHGDKIIYERYGWANDKSELRNRALQLLGKDITHVLVVDADEIWSQKNLDRLVDAMKNYNKAGAFFFNFYHFFKNMKQVAIGGQWNSQMFRCFKYEDKSFHFNLHNAPVVNDKNEFINAVTESIVLDDVYVYHLGYVKHDKNIIDKLEYYKKRDDFLPVKTNWLEWNKDMPSSFTHNVGTVKEYLGKYPDEINYLIEEGSIK